MNFSLRVRKFISYILIFVFTFLNTAQATSTIESSVRSSDIISDMLKSSTPSDLPVAGVSNFFDKENVHLVDQFDLKGNASELKILYANHKTAHKILCDIDEKIHKGDLVKYGYDF